MISRARARCDVRRRDRKLKRMTPDEIADYADTLTLAELRCAVSSTESELSRLNGSSSSRTCDNADTEIAIWRELRKLRKKLKRVQALEHRDASALTAEQRRLIRTKASLAAAIVALSSSLTPGVDHAALNAQRNQRPAAGCLADVATARALQRKGALEYVERQMADAEMAKALARDFERAESMSCSDDAAIAAALAASFASSASAQRTAARSTASKKGVSARELEAKLYARPSAARRPAAELSAARARDARTPRAIEELRRLANEQAEAMVHHKRRAGRLHHGGAGDRMKQIGASVHALIVSERGDVPRLRMRELQLEAARAVFVAHNASGTLERPIEAEQLRRGGSVTVDLHGLKRDEACRVTKLAIEALRCARGGGAVTLLHGNGSGALRDALRVYLRKQQDTRVEVQGRDSLVVVLRSR